MLFLPYFLITHVCLNLSIGIHSHTLFLGGVPMACGNSLARDQNRATAETQGAAVTMPDAYPAVPREDPCLKTSVASVLPLEQQQLLRRLWIFFQYRHSKCQPLSRFLLREKICKALNCILGPVSLAAIVAKLKRDFLPGPSHTLLWRGCHVTFRPPAPPVELPPGLSCPILCHYTCVSTPLFLSHTVQPHDAIWDPLLFGPQHCCPPTSLCR